LLVCRAVDGRVDVATAVFTRTVIAS